MKYNGPQTTDTKPGLNAHTDKYILTILYQNQIEGLEVQTKDGQWISQTLAGLFCRFGGRIFPCKF